MDWGRARGRSRPRWIVYFLTGSKPSENADGSSTGNVDSAAVTTPATPGTSADTGTSSPVPASMGWITQIQFRKRLTGAFNWPRRFHFPPMKRRLLCLNWHHPISQPLGLNPRQSWTSALDNRFITLPSQRRLGSTRRSASTGSIWLSMQSESISACPRREARHSEGESSLSCMVN